MINKEVEKYIEDIILNNDLKKPFWNVEVKEGLELGWNYIDALIMQSLLLLYETRHEKKYLDYVIKYTNQFIDKDGNIPSLHIEEYSLDNLSESKILFDLYDYTKDEKYRKAIEYSYEQIKTEPRTKEGNFWHKPRHKNQVWLDGLYMGLVFYTKYEIKLNNKKNLDDIIMMFRNVRNIMWNDKTGLYYHGYDSERTAFWCNKETGLSKGHWLRACGWHLMALVDILEMLEKDSKEYTYLKSLYIEALNGILKYQDKETNMFYNVPEFPKREGNYLETSGSSMISYSISKAIRLEILSSEYKLCATNIFNGIVDKYLKEEDGHISLDGICLMAGLGNALFRDGSYEYYISESVVKNDAKGLGPFLLAYIELNRI